MKKFKKTSYNAIIMNNINFSGVNTICYQLENYFLDTEQNLSDIDNLTNAAYINSIGICREEKDKLFCLMNIFLYKTFQL